MKLGIRKVIADGLKDFPNIPIEDISDTQSVSTHKMFNERTQWLARWQSQVIIVVSQIFWTMQVEQALTNVSSLKMLVKIFR
jgi:hypothetical protein